MAEPPPLSNDSLSQQFRRRLSQKQGSTTGELVWVTRAEDGSEAERRPLWTVLKESLLLGYDGMEQIGWVRVSDAGCRLQPTTLRVELAHVGRAATILQCPDKAQYRVWSAALLQACRRSSTASAQTAERGLSLEDRFAARPAETEVLMHEKRMDSVRLIVAPEQHSLAAESDAGSRPPLSGEAGWDILRRALDRKGRVALSPSGVMVSQFGESAESAERQRGDDVPRIIPVSSHGDEVTDTAEGPVSAHPDAASDSPTARSKATSEEAQRTPPVLHVDAPPPFGFVTGRYALCEEKVNGWPSWSDGRRVVYTTRHGRWAIADSDRDVRKDTGVLQSHEPHVGRLPHQLRWMAQRDGKWRGNEQVVVMPAPNSSSVRRPDCPVPDAWCIGGVPLPADASIDSIVRWAEKAGTTGGSAPRVYPPGPMSPPDQALPAPAPPPAPLTSPAPPPAPPTTAPDTATPSPPVPPSSPPSPPLLPYVACFLDRATLSPKRPAAAAVVRSPTPPVSPPLVMQLGPDPVWDAAAPTPTAPVASESPLHAADAAPRDAYVDRAAVRDASPAHVGRASPAHVGRASPAHVDRASPAHSRPAHTAPGHSRPAPAQVCRKAPSAAKMADGGHPACVQGPRYVPLREGEAQSVARGRDTPPPCRKPFYLARDSTLGQRLAELLDRDAAQADAIAQCEPPPPPRAFIGRRESHPTPPEPLLPPPPPPPPQQSTPLEQPLRQSTPLEQPPPQRGTLLDPPQRGTPLDPPQSADPPPLPLRPRWVQVSPAPPAESLWKMPSARTPSGTAAADLRRVSALSAAGDDVVRTPTDGSRAASGSSDGGLFAGRRQWDEARAALRQGAVFTRHSVSTGAALRRHVGLSGDGRWLTWTAAEGAGGAETRAGYMAASSVRKVVIGVAPEIQGELVVNALVAKRIEPKHLLCIVGDAKVLVLEADSATQCEVWANRWNFYLFSASRPRAD
eukprot:TRINITY_DN1670_c0_g1_i5.p1 TRINITY_DN1670_c0_g1~~TRINITY_DN1670_c0_g1_i5.p1  ORF type:complete len:979 (+),score=283.56 TRINITY_DN1670_c0_g1_i5:45-2939(+)